MTSRTTPVRAPYDVGALRRAEFPWTANTIYLNHAGIGPLPERARRAIEANTRERAAPVTLTDDRLMGVLADGRAKAARLIGADPEEIALATNTSFGLNLAARMLPLSPGDVVLVSDQDFPANVFAWRQLVDRGVRLEIIPRTPDGWPDELRMMERMQDPRVRVLAVSQVEFHTGYRADLAGLGEAARATATFFVVDAIQALGHIGFDVRDTPVDILACGAQKWLLSPWGSGFMYVRRELIESLTSPLAGWNAYEGTENFSTLVDYGGRLRGDARRFELWTLPYQDILGMNLALDLLHELGLEVIEAHVAAIGEPVLEWARRTGVRLRSPEGARSAGIIALDAEDVPGGLAALRGAGVATVVREGGLRLAPHCYNTIQEMEQVVDLLDQSLSRSPLTAHR
jgi:selenocysteine lyase/cysteine desulfurase